MNPTVTPENKGWSTSDKLVAVGLPLLIAIGAFVQQGASTTHTVVAPMTTSAAAPVASPVEDKSAFVSLKSGMSYKQAVAILGAEGEVVASDEMSGIKTVLYEWKDDKVWATKNALFQNDKLVSKKQFEIN